MREYNDRITSSCSLKGDGGSADVGNPVGGVVVKGRRGETGNSEYLFSKQNSLGKRKRNRNSKQLSNDKMGSWFFRVYSQPHIYILYIGIDIIIEVRVTVGCRVAL